MAERVAEPPIEGNPRRLEGKILVISGGTQGCGEGIALACAHEGAAGITICGRQVDKGEAVVAALEAIGTQALFVRADLTDADQAKNVIAQADAKFGRIDGLVNCAAVATRGDWYDTPVDDIDWLLKLNFRAPFLLTQAAANVMRREGTGGSVVNIGSINCRGGQSNLPVYSCTKAALMAMTKHAAWALRKERIRSNYIAVGWMFTPAEDSIQQKEGNGPEWIDKADANHPYGRLLRPIDVAKMTIHLLSDDAVMQSGAVIDLHETYGLTCWDGQPDSN